jgi:hypothetical protein
MKSITSISISIAAVCFILVIISINAFNIDSIAVASSNTMNVVYQVGIPGETKNGMPLSNMTVILLVQGFDNNTNSYRTFGMADVPNNPLTSSNDNVLGGPAYSWKNIPVLPNNEIYVVETERNGREWDEFGPVWQNGYVEQNDSFYDNHTFPIPQNISNGSLYGFVILNNGSGQIYQKRVAGATVTLYSCLSYNASNGNVNTGLVNIPDNPQISMSGDDIGMYQFNGLKPGFYNVTVEMDGMTGFQIINFTSDEANNNWIDNNMVLLQPTPVNPVVTPTPQATISVTPTPTVSMPSNTTGTSTLQATISITPTQIVSTSTGPSTTQNNNYTQPAGTPVPSPGFDFNTILMLGCTGIIASLAYGMVRRKK